MSRLIAFGCSHTYGHGLKDCIKEANRPGDEPSKFAWPQILGDKLNLEVINKSKPGASNLEILFHILNFQFNPSDLVIILWSYSIRDMIFTTEVVGANNQMHYSIRPNLRNKNNTIIENYYEIHTEHDLQIKTFIHMHHAEIYLEYLKIKNYSFSIDLYESFPIFASLKNYKKLDFRNSLRDYALDNSHPGEESHKALAEDIRSYIYD